MFIDILDASLWLEPNDLRTMQPTVDTFSSIWRAYTQTHTIRREMYLLIDLRNNATVTWLHYLDNANYYSVFNSDINSSMAKSFSPKLYFKVS